MGYLSNSWARVRSVFVSMPPSQRYTVAALMVVVGLSLVLLIMWGGRDERTPALMDLSPQQMSAMDTALKGSAIDYRFDSGMLLVKPADKDKVLMALSEKGSLPTDISRAYDFSDIVKPSGLNFDTAEQQAIKYNIALGNTLARAIMSMPEIKVARVHVNSARSSIFADEKATAAVEIEPNGSASLSAAKMDAICRFVAASVGPKLPPEAVVLTNFGNGQVYSIGDQNSAFGKASNLKALQEEWDRYYRKACEDYLRPVFGSVQALVHTDVDVTSRKMTDVEYEVTKNRTRTSTTSGADAAPGGDTLTTPNTAASVTGYATGAAQGAKSEDTEKETTASPSKTVDTDVPPGDVKSVSIAVLADLRKVEAVIRFKDRLKAEDAVSQERITQEYDVWKSQIMTALPVDLASKTVRVQFTAAPFDTFEMAPGTAVATTSTGSAAMEFVLVNWQRLGLAMLALVALVMIRSIATRSIVETREKTVVEVEEEIDLPEVEVDIEKRRAAKVRESIEEMVRRDPQTAVGLIRRWIARES